MSFEDLKASLALLLEEMTDEPEDPHALQEELRETIARMRAMGMPVPDDLEELQAWLTEELAVPPRKGDEG